jgi:hypothetical protein
MRGGAGVVRDYRILADGIQASLSSARQINPVQGFSGDGVPFFGQRCGTTISVCRSRFVLAAGQILARRPIYFIFAPPLSVAQVALRIQ